MSSLPSICCMIVTRFVLLLATTRLGTGSDLVTSCEHSCCIILLTEVQLLPFGVE